MKATERAVTMQTRHAITNELQLLQVLPADRGFPVSSVLVVTVSISFLVFSSIVRLKASLAHRL